MSETKKQLFVRAWMAQHEAAAAIEALDAATKQPSPKHSKDYDAWLRWQQTVRSVRQARSDLECLGKDVFRSSEL